MPPDPIACRNGLVAFLAATMWSAAASTFAQRPTPESVIVVGCIAREVDYPRATLDGPKDDSQLVLTRIDSAAPSHALTGVREKDLASLAGRRVQVSGTIEPARTTPVLTTAEGARDGSVNSEGRGATGVTPDGAAAHEPADALATTVKAGPVSEAVPNPGDPAYRLATVPRLNVTSFKPVAGGCVGPASRAATASAPQQAGQRSTVAQAPQRPEPRRVIARGCLMRLTPGGTALTQQRDSQDAIVLTKASLAGPPQPVTPAVPGGAPDRGSGSGTVPASPAARAPAPGDSERLTFTLSLRREIVPRITPLVGDLVEVEGLLEDEPESSPSRAHTSAPAGRITVGEFRPLGGACK